MRAFRFLTVTAMVAATVATASVSQAQPRRPRPAPGAAPAAPPPPAPAAAPIPPVAQAPGDVAPNAPTLLSRESEIRRGLGFQAFLDGQLSIPSKVYTDDRGFTLNDAAIYLSKDFGSGFAAMIDLPFMTPDGAANNSVQFGEEKAQAFVQWNHGMFQTKFGQFDTIFGVEQNDSKDRFFADWGLAKQAIVPITHTGALIGLGFEHFMIRGLIADPRNTSTQTNQNLEFGLQGRVDFAPAYASVGVLYNEGKTATERTNLLIDVLGGVKLDAWRLDAYYNNRSTAGVADASNTLGVLTTFNINPEFGLGGRLEWSKDLVVANTALDSALLLSVGPSWKVLPEITLRGDATLSSVERANNAGDTTIYGVNASLVAGF